MLKISFLSKNIKQKLKFLGFLRLEQKIEFMNFPIFRGNRTV